MVSTTRSSFGSNEKANKYAKENSRDKHGTPLEQLKKFVGIDDGPVEKGLVPRRKPVGSAEAEARKTADGYKAAYKDEIAAARVERNKGVTPPKPTSRPDNGKKSKMLRRMYPSTR
jgi:hypothetical protein